MSYISKKKKQIQVKTNTIVKEYIIKFEIMLKEHLDDYEGS